ncbi:glutathione S-transferase family protein [Striga asiatica]|uniref:Glutathione S-transferase family protein n=1 Tax=Striga asiatica TaxID=4170 RepID=A0A5A7PMF7_STRAF|nr:glutathione S-transferase family protein [Striga asiatica]
MERLKLHPNITSKPVGDDKHDFRKAMELSKYGTLRTTKMAVTQLVQALAFIHKCGFADTLTGRYGSLTSPCNFFGGPNADPDLVGNGSQPIISGLPVFEREGILGTAGGEPIFEKEVAHLISHLSTGEKIPENIKFHREKETSQGKGEQLPTAPQLADFSYMKPKGWKTLISGLTFATLRIAKRKRLGMLLTDVSTLEPPLTQ